LKPLIIPTLLQHYSTIFEPSIKVEKGDQMNQTSPFSNIHFNRPQLPRRWIPVIIAAVLFIFIWRFANPGTVFWIGLLMTSILVWVASFGWRQALMVLIEFLHYLSTR